MHILFFSTVIPLLVFTSPAVIEKLQKDEIPEDFYDRVSKIPVNAVTQELFSEDSVLSVTDITKAVDENPLLQDMPMFKNRQNGVKQADPPEPISFDENQFGGSTHRVAVTDNFDDEYRRVNASLFHLAIPMDEEIVPTGRSLADDGPPPEFSEELMTTDIPFAVTDSLLSSLATAGQSSASSPPATTAMPRPVFTVPPLPIFDSAATVPNGNSLEDGSFEDISHTSNKVEPTGMAASYFKGVGEIPSPSLAATNPPITTTPESVTIIPTLSPIDFREFTGSEPSIPNHFLTGFQGMPSSGLENTSGLGQNELSSGGSEEIGQNIEDNMLTFEREVVGERDRTTLPPPPARPKNAPLLVNKSKAIREMKIKNGLPESVFRGFFYPELEDIPHLTDGRRVDEDKVMKTERGKFRVSATKYYKDNRVDSDVMVEEYKPRRASVELKDMLEDPRYIIETEVSRLRAHGHAMKRMNKAISQGTKTLSGSPIVTSTSADEKGTPKKNRTEKDPPTFVKMSIDNGRPVEHRMSLIGGKMVNVTLANMILHGHDYIVWPGSYINGKMPFSETVAPKSGMRHTSRAPVYETSVSSKGSESTTSVTLDPTNQKEIDIIAREIELLEKRRDSNGANTQINKDSAEDCFEMFADTTLMGAKPFERRIGNKPNDCLKICAVVEGCLSVVFANRLSICDIYAVRPGEEGSRTQSLKGAILYTPKRPNIKRCMADGSRAAHGVSIKTDLELEEELSANAKSKAKNSLITSIGAKPRCSRGQAVLLIRTDGYRNPRGSNMDTMYDISEDDCVFSCLTNSAIDSHPLDCATAQYLDDKQECILSNERQKLELETAKGYMFYEKVCIAESAVHQCSGATVDRIPQSVLVGYMREAKSAHNVGDCLSMCVSSRSIFGFKCVSVMFYYDEQVNCILNDASAYSDPHALSIEDEDIHVDYFGIEECFGIPNAPLEGGKRKLKKLHFNPSASSVEDDVHSGEITKGSSVQDMRKRKRVKRRRLRKH